MRKFISLLLVAVMLLSLTACGGKTNGQLSDNSSSAGESSSSNVNNTGVNPSDDASQNNETGTSAGKSQVVKVTIPEGYTLLRIAWLLEDKGLCKTQEFIDAAQTIEKWLDIDEYPFLRGALNTPNVCFYLEGYIFPLTYDIPEGTDVKDIIKTFLNGTRMRFGSDFMARVNASGHSLHEILTIASIVEKEAATNEQRPVIASVLYNRLKANMPFQCDVCIKYCEGVIKVQYPDKFPTVKEYYNSKNQGIIAGPICNPGMASINAAISPEDTEYLYFIIGTVPPYEAHYSKTYEEHNTFWQENKDRLTGNA